MDAAHLTPMMVMAILTPVIVLLMKMTMEMIALAWVGSVGRLCRLGSASHRNPAVSPNARYRRAVMRVSLRHGKRTPSSTPMDLTRLGRK
ncbi:hypothetical protein [Mesorhizobium sp.]|uniref:hypothetical protein n=1 Tax=Mesorhizobium sp. TaxID=1871066 RepID=UPI000FE4C5F9|nr:hypothetical protein [Mesorhizobium sp.]RWP51050.1 MAG: hypothetical protein EOR05_03775 [Mesorhizobium sp.]